MPQREIARNISSMARKGVQEGHYFTGLLTTVLDFMQDTSGAIQALRRMLFLCLFYFRASPLWTRSRQDPWQRGFLAMLEQVVHDAKKWG